MPGRHGSRGGGMPRGGGQHMHGPAPMHGRGFWRGPAPRFNWRFSPVWFIPSFFLTLSLVDQYIWLQRNVEIAKQEEYLDYLRQQGALEDELNELKREAEERKKECEVHPESEACKR